MKLEIRGVGLEMTDALRSHTQHRLRFALGRFGRRVQRVTVRFATTNGSHTCRVVADTSHAGQVMIEDRDRDGYVASGRAISRLGRAVARATARARMVG